MKKVILFAAILFSGISVVKAQNEVRGSSNLTLKLSPVQSLTVVTNEGAFIEYETMADYSGDGVESTGNTTINVSSAGGYTVRVSADEFTTTNGGTLSLGTINVIATAQGVKATGTPQDATLIQTVATNPLIGNTLIVGGAGGVDMKYDIKFKGAGGNDYLDVYNQGTNNVTQEYTTTVYYTIAAN